MRWSSFLKKKKFDTTMFMPSVIAMQGLITGQEGQLAMTSEQWRRNFTCVRITKDKLDKQNLLTEMYLCSVVVIYWQSRNQTQQGPMSCLGGQGGWIVWWWYFSPKDGWETCQSVTGLSWSAEIWCQMSENNKVKWLRYWARDEKVVSLDPTTTKLQGLWP